MNKIVIKGDREAANGENLIQALFDETSDETSNEEANVWIRKQS